MKSVATIRDYLADYLKTNHMTLNQFSEISGINSGTLSGTLNGLRPIGVQQLDRLTAGMGLTEGYFYELYIHECFVHTSPDWRRLGPFLYRCAELGKVDYMEEAVNLIMDNLSYAPLLFELAEQLYLEGKLEAAKPLYLCVAEGEKMQHSERLALSQYRLFTIGLSKDQLSNLTLATQFEFLQIGLMSTTSWMD
ncbi:helix-turn-helix transcriptional regulator [Paenibacillus sp. OVF10]|nr:helix-turn-helix transcriptional regulator [Paenibacillus sp. OVF10]